MSLGNLTGLTTSRGVAPKLLRVLYANLGNLETVAVIIILGLGFLCVSEVKYAGFLPSSKNPDSLFKNTKAV